MATRRSALIASTRPLAALVVGTLSAAAAIAGAGRLTLRGAAAGLAMTALAMFGFVVNDLFDRRKDREAGVERPIASGAVSPGAATCAAAALLVLALILAAAVGTGVAVLAFTAAALVAYSPLALHFPLTKDLYVAALCCAPLWYGDVTAAAPRSWLSYATLMCFVFGREVLMDSDELQGDRRAGIHTIAATLGRRRTTRMGAALMLVAAGILVAIVRGPTLTAAAAATLLLLACVLTWPRIDDGVRIRLTLVPMYVGSVALACGGV
ncbi:MAG: UbiA family prenyltransferase [Gemmatimonadales bacterium]